MLGWAGHVDTQFLGYVPGVDFRPAQQPGAAPIEVDLVAIHTGRVLLAECKETGKWLTLDEVQRLFELSRQLQASRLILATRTDFREVSEVVDHARAATGDIALEEWTGEELLDTTYWFPRERATPEGYVHEMAAMLEWLKAN
jgi:hypothetical protein